MGAPKLVIWDLDETILGGIFEEGDRDVVPAALALIQRLHERGVLQALATQNPSTVLDEVREEFPWFECFVHGDASLGPKADKVRNCLDRLDVHVSGAAFVDSDPFERDSIAAQVPGIRGLSIEDLEAAIDSTAEVTEESSGRPRMYKAEMRRNDDADGVDYETFLRGCGIRMKVRDYCSGDLARVGELLTRTHRMNLGVASLEETIHRLDDGSHRTVIAEICDDYGDMGRCGVVQIGENHAGHRMIECLAISCRTRARGLSLAMLVSLLRRAGTGAASLRCRYQRTDRNRPLRMLLLAAGFKPIAGTDEFELTSQKLASLETPDWFNIEFAHSDEGPVPSCLP